MQATDDIQSSLLHFKRYVFMPRTERSLMWIVVLHFILTPILTIPLHIILHPSSPTMWVANSFSSILSSGGVVRHILLVAGTCVLALFHVKYFSVSPIIIDKRIKVVPNLLNISTLIFYSTMSLIGGVFTWCYLGMQGELYRSLTVKCIKKSSELGEGYRDRYCLNEKHLFLLLHGVFASLLWAIQYLRGYDRHLKFPIQSQSLSAAIRPSIIPLLKRSLHAVLRSIPFFYIGYYLRGHIIQRTILKLANVQLLHEPMDTVLSFTDVRLTLTLLYASTLVIFDFKLWCKVFEVIHCQNYKFAVEKDVYCDRNIVIGDGMAAWDFHLMQYLAYLDLKSISERSESRRKEVFSLSTPGGHPHNWNKVTDESLSIISGFTKHLTTLTYPTSKEVPKQCIPNIPPSESRTYGSGPSDQELMLQWLRSRLSLQHIIFRPMFEELKHLANKFMDLPLMRYLFGEISGSNFAKLFADSQPVIWAVEALGNLVVYSYKEDSYGVVQTRIGEILSKFLDLHIILEQQSKPPGFLSRNKFIRPLPRERRLSEALRLTVKSSIYKIVVTFGSHLNAISIPSSQKSTLALFSEFRES